MSGYMIHTGTALHSGSTVHFSLYIDSFHFFSLHIDFFHLLYVISVRIDLSIYYPVSEYNSLAFNHVNNATVCCYVSIPVLQHHLHRSGNDVIYRLYCTVARSTTLLSLNTPQLACNRGPPFLGEKVAKILELSIMFCESSLLFFFISEKKNIALWFATLTPKLTLIVLSLAQR